MFKDTAGTVLIEASLAHYSTVLEQMQEITRDSGDCIVYPGLTAPGKKVFIIYLELPTVKVFEDVDNWCQRAYSVKMIRMCRIAGVDSLVVLE